MKFSCRWKNRRINLKYIIEVVLFFVFFTFLIFFLHNKEVSGRLKLLFLDICLIAICIKYRYVVKQGEITSVTRYVEVICMILMLTIGIFIYE